MNEKKTSAVFPQQKGRDGGRCSYFILKIAKNGVNELVCSATMVNYIGPYQSFFRGESDTAFQIFYLFLHFFYFNFAGYFNNNNDGMMMTTTSTRKKPNVHII